MALCVHQWERTDGTRHTCKKCGAIGYRRRWAGKNKKVLRYLCATCGRIATKVVWRGTHEQFICSTVTCQRKGDREVKPSEKRRAA